MIEYCTAPLLEAVISIVPSFTPQSVGSVDATFEIVGAVGAVNICVAPATTQVPPRYLTRIA